MSDVSRETRKVFNTLSKDHQKVLLNMVERGMNQTNAYMDAYPDSSHDSARSSVCDVLAIPSVKEALQELKDEQRERAAVDHDWALSKLVELVDIGMFRPSPEQLAALTEEERLQIAKIGTDINAVKGVINEINRMQGNHAAIETDNKHTLNPEEWLNQLK